MEEIKTILQTSHRLRYTLIIEGFLVGGCAGIISIVYQEDCSPMRRSGCNGCRQ